MYLKHFLNVKMLFEYSIPFVLMYSRIVNMAIINVNSDELLLSEEQDDPDSS